MFTDPTVGILALFTLVAVLGFGFWQYRSVRGSQARRGEKAGATGVPLSIDPDLSAPSGAPAAPTTTVADAAKLDTTRSAQRPESETVSPR